MIFGLDAYNPASQVTQRSTSNDAYVWTGAYNVNRDYAVNGFNQYTSAGPATFSYDANGNLTGDGVTSYVYDVENRLVSTATASGSATTASLRYDPLGRLYEVAGANGLTRFLHDGDELVAEFDGNTNIQLRRYLHGVSVDDPVIAYEGSGFNQPRWLHSNHQGSIVAISDNTGAVTVKNTFDEWGIPGSSNASIAAGGRFSYTGQAWIPELGMYYYKARIYSPTLGRFMQTDPVGYKDQMNLYGYVGNDPVNGTDPSGMYSCVQTKGSLVCRGFRNAQTAVAARLNNAISDLKSYRGKVESGGQFSKQDKAFASNFEKYVGSGASKDLGKIDSVIGAAQNAANDLDSLRKTAEFVPGRDIGNDAARSMAGGAAIKLNKDIFTEKSLSGFAGSAFFRHTILHEAIHSGSRNSILDFGVYEKGDVINRAESGQSYMVTNQYIYALGLGYDQ